MQKTEKIKIQIHILIVFFLVHSLPLYAQNTDTTYRKRYKNELGLLGSIDSGIGISYRNSLNDRFKVQASTMPYYFKIFQKVSYAQFIGVALQGNFIQRNKIDVYGYIGNHVGLAFIDNSGIVPIQYIAGAGTGINFYLSQRMTLQVQAGVCAVFIDRDGILFSPGIGLLFGLGKK